MRTESLMRCLLAAALPIALLSACADRETGVPPAAEMTPAGADASPTAAAPSEVARGAGSTTLSQLQQSLEANGLGAAPPIQRMTRQEVAARFAASADAGDPASAYIAGRSLAECHRILRDDTPQAMLSRQREDTLELQQHEGTPGYEMLRQQLEQRSAKRVAAYSDCNALAPGLIARSVGWLEQAAAAGHLDARKDYPSLAMLEFETREGIIRDPMEARRRQALAREYLEDAVRAGDPRALDLYLGAQYGRGPLYPEDRRAAQVYGYVQQLAMHQPRPADPVGDAVQARLDRLRVEQGGASREDRFQSLLRNGPPRSSSSEFSDAEWADITAEGRRIFEDAFRTDTPAR